MRQRVVHAQRHAAADDLGLGHRDQGGADRDPAPLDGGLRRQVRHRLEGAEVLRAAVGVARVVQGVDADEDVPRVQHLRIGQRVGEEDRVPRRDVGHGDAAADLAGVAPLGDRDVRGQRRAAEGAQVDRDQRGVPRAQRVRDAERRVGLDGVPLPVAEDERVAVEPLRPGDGQGRRGIEPPGE